MTMSAIPPRTWLSQEEAHASHTRWSEDAAIHELIVEWMTDRPSVVP
jgi:hypothetical protein